MKPIKIFDLKFDQKDINFFSKNSRKIFKEGFFSNHTFVKKFEKEFKKQNRSKFASYSPYTCFRNNFKIIQN